MKLIDFLKKEKVFGIVLFFALLAMARSFIVPLGGDEITYHKISDSMLTGKFFLNGHPSTFNPIIPFILTFFRTDFLPELGFILNKTFNILLFGGGLFYAYRFFLRHQIKQSISLAIILLCIAFPICISTVPSLYPDALLFFAFWGFVLYSSEEVSSSNFGKMLLFFTLLVLVRYLYAVLGVFVIYNFYQLLKKDPNDLPKAVLYGMLALLPILVWVKYVYNVETNNLTQLSYFNRFKEESSLWYNIKAGLGLIQHQEVKRINGIPAFVNLFVPITGFRNYGASALLILLFVTGYLITKKETGLKILFGAIALIMLGLVFAGTGFTRYWMPLVPGFLLGYYFLFRKLKIKDIFFVNAVYLLTFIYLINELRLIYVVLNNNL